MTDTENDPTVWTNLCGQTRVTGIYLNGHYIPMDTKEIKPALTAEEWAEIKRLSARGYFQATADLPPQLRALALDFDQFRAMAVANAALPDDDPRKITRDEVAMIAEEARVRSWNGTHYDLSLAPDWNRLAAKLAALLPPE